MAYRPLRYSVDIEGRDERRFVFLAVIDETRAQRPGENKRAYRRLNSAVQTMNSSQILLIPGSKLETR